MQLFFFKFPIFFLQDFQFLGKNLYYNIFFPNFQYFCKGFSISKHLPYAQHIKFNVNNSLMKNFILFLYFLTFSTYFWQNIQQNIYCLLHYLSNFFHKFIYRTGSITFCSQIEYHSLIEAFYCINTLIK